MFRSVATNRSWGMKGLSGVEKRESEGAAFTLVFETGRRCGSRYEVDPLRKEGSLVVEGVPASLVLALVLVFFSF